MLATVQFGDSSIAGSPGGLAEFGAEGKLVRIGWSRDSAFAGARIRTYGIAVVTKADRAVTTSSPMDNERTANVIQVWRLSDLTLLKLIQSIIKTLHSDGTPGQVAAGMALGAALGLTPLMNVHNLIIFSLIVLLNVSFGGGMLGWALFVPLGFLLDPVFDRIGASLLLAPSLRSLWTSWYNTPLMPYTNFNNTVVMGSVVGWLVLAVPIFFAARWGIARYRATIGERVRQSKFYKALTASQVYNWYRLFRPS